MLPKHLEVSMPKLLGSLPGVPEGCEVHGAVGMPEAVAWPLGEPRPFPRGSKPGVVGVTRAGQTGPQFLRSGFNHATRLSLILTNRLAAVLVRSAATSMRRLSKSTWDQSSFHTSDSPQARRTCRSPRPVVDRSRSARATPQPVPRSRCRAGGQPPSPWRYSPQGWQGTRRA